MGACGSLQQISSEGNEFTHLAEKNKKIQKTLAIEKLQAEKTIKMLLLGAGQSGKTTLLKQLKLLHGHVSDEERMAYVVSINSNIVSGTQILLLALLSAQSNASSPASSFVDPSLGISSSQHNISSSSYTPPSSYNPSFSSSYNPSFSFPSSSASSSSPPSSSSLLAATSVLSGTLFHQHQNHHQSALSTFPSPLASSISSYFFFAEFF